MRTLAHLFVLLALACAAPASTVLPTPATDPADAIEPAIALATFDTVEAMVARSWVDTAFTNRRWKAIADSLRPIAARAMTRGELHRVLRSMLARIGESHFYLIPASVATELAASRPAGGNGSTGVSVRVAEGRLVVWTVEEGSAGAALGVRPGEIVDSVDGRAAAAALAQIRALPGTAGRRATTELLYGLNGLLAPGVGDSVRLVTTTREGQPAARTLVAKGAKGTITQFGNLPPLAARVEARRLRPQGGSGCVGIVALNIWLPAVAPEIDRALGTIRDCRGVVLDLRGNPGGVAGMVMGTGGHFLDSTISLGTMRSRQGELRFVVNPRRVDAAGRIVTPFAGPLAILVDPMTASTSELFAAGLQRIGRARVFGEQSAGQALPAMMERLPSGDVFVHAIADLADPDGERIEGDGVVPDEIVPLTVEALARGSDAALEAALAWIGSAAPAR